jgi:hypothetical protein
MLSHRSLPVAVLAAALALLYFGFARDFGAAALVAAIVHSHAVADYATGLKPTWPVVLTSACSSIGIRQLISSSRQR